MCLYVCAEKARGTSPDVIADLIDALDLKFHLTGQEAGFLIDDPGVREGAIVYSWGYEGAAALLWAGSLLDALAFPTSAVDPEDVAKPILEAGSWRSLAAGIRPRNESKIVDEGSLAWALYQHCLAGIRNDASIPDGINYAAVYYRSYALTWLLDPQSRGWDELHKVMDAGIS